MNQEATGFSFMAPDRGPIETDSVEKLIKTAHVILSTGVPNYLCSYADKCLLQYIKFGYLLSLNNPHELCNKEVINHFSAYQYSK